MAILVRSALLLLVGLAGVTALAGETRRARAEFQVSVVVLPQCRVGGAAPDCRHVVGRDLQVVQAVGGPSMAPTLLLLRNTPSAPSTSAPLGLSERGAVRRLLIRF